MRVEDITSQDKLYKKKDLHKYSTRNKKKNLHNVIYLTYPKKATDIIFKMHNFKCHNAPNMLIKLLLNNKHGTVVLNGQKL